MTVTYTGQALDVITADALAAELGVTKQTLADWRYRGTGPVFVRTGPRKVLYRRVDVAAWLEANRFVRTDQPAA